MLDAAWHTAWTVPFVAAVMALTAAGTTLTELFVAPVVLHRIEVHASLGGMLLDIAAFAAGLVALAAVHDYFDQISFSGNVEVRVSIVKRIGLKASGTAYANMLDADFNALEEKSYRNCSGNDAATEKFWRTWTEILTNVFGFVAYLFVLANLSIWMILLVIVTAGVGYAAAKRINEWGYRHREEERARLKRYTYLNDVFGKREYAKDMRILNLRPWILELRNRAFRALLAFYARREANNLWANVIDVALAFARNGIAYAYLIRLTLAQGLTASEFLLYFTAVSGFGMWVTGILDQFAELNKESLELSQIREFLDWPEPYAFEDGEPLKRRPGHAYRITLEHVSFRYPGADRDTLHDVSLDIRPGERLAVVGLNGAGKTTLVKLVCGLLDPTSGRVLVDGVDVRQYDRRDYYALFSAVFQDFSVLDSTVAQNVAQRVDGIDRARVEACLGEAGLMDAVGRLPGGVDAHMGRGVYEDGVELSGGQTQRLMLARALYKDAPVLVLDEPTAALDPIAEDDVYRHYARMTAGRTSVFISHRLASTRFCDRIVFLAGGRIAEEGTHESLLAMGGGYARLFEVQSKYYRDDMNAAAAGDAVAGDDGRSKGSQ
ncbi:ABC transporter ATP-binding protein [Bifidobacterium avesanii]|nr:ABC transporter ATP-binding protein [Bifidobacterium avesanii]